MTGWSFLIVAAGRGKRFGGHPKQFEDLGGLPSGRGRPGQR